MPRVGVVELVVLTQRGRPRIAEMRLVGDGDRGITGVTLDGTPASDLLERAVKEMGWISSRAGTASARSAAKRATRKKPDTPRLEEVAKAHRLAGIDGIVKLGVSERHAYRLKKAAVEAGLLEGDRR
jgi:hypothetical protein